ncbi:MAG TPA: PxKF domain-containing protein, partial [Nakamurella sp.]
RINCGRGRWARGTVSVLLAGTVLAVGAASPGSAATQPSVSGISPTHGPEAGGTTVTITGADLTGTTAVTFGAAPGTNVIVANDSEVTATAPPHAFATVDVTVTSVGGTSATSGVDRYTYDEPAPAVSGINPAHGPEAGGNTVTVTGLNLASTTAVTFGAVPGSNVTVVDDHTVNVTAPPARHGTVDVTVTNPSGTSPTSGADRYSYIYPFGGFLGPVANPPAVNKAHAGQSVPVPFSLGGNEGLGILAAGYPTVQQVNCGNGSPIGSSAPVGTAGNSGLQYSKATGTYTFVWKTAKAFAGTCQVFTLGLNDGTFHTANFKFS